MATPSPTATPAPVTVLLRGDVSDASGDAQSFQFKGPGADLVSASVDILSDGTIRFRIRFAPGTFAKATTEIQVEMDTDLNPATGARRVGITDIGIEYFMEVGSNYNGAFASLRKYDGVRLFPTVSSVEATFLPDGVDVTIPGDGIRGPFAFRVLSQSQIDLTGFSSVQDAMPNDRTPPARVQ